LILDFAGVAPRVVAEDAAVLVLAGLAGREEGVRAFDIDAAVGLLRRSAALLLKVAFFVGAGGCGSAFRALAREAAVGANRPDGVFERTVEGVLGRVAVDGVFDDDGGEG